MTARVHSWAPADGVMGRYTCACGAFGYRAGIHKLDQAAADCDRLGAPGLDCVLRVYAAGPGWRSAGAERSANEFLALAHELALHLTDTRRA